MNNDSFEFIYELHRGDNLSVEAREIYRRNFKKAFFNFLEQYSIGYDKTYKCNDIQFYSGFVGEIVLNVWDHTATGQGLTIFTFRPQTLLLDFEIMDCDIIPHNLESIRAYTEKNGSSKKGSGVNCGAGLNFIHGSITPLNIQNFTIDTSCGFSYKGSLPLKKTPSS